MSRVTHEGDGVRGRRGPSSVRRRAVAAMLVAPACGLAVAGFGADTPHRRRR